jgi:hypothetical protein
MGGAMSENVLISCIIYGDLQGLSEISEIWKLKLESDNCELETHPPLLRKFQLWSTSYIWSGET